MKKTNLLILASLFSFSVASCQLIKDNTSTSQNENNKDSKTESNVETKSNESSKDVLDESSVSNNDNVNESVEISSEIISDIQDSEISVEESNSTSESSSTTTTYNFSDDDVNAMNTYLGEVLRFPDVDTSEYYRETSEDDYIAYAVYTFDVDNAEEVYNKYCSYYEDYEGFETSILDTASFYVNDILVSLYVDNTEFSIFWTYYRELSWEDVNNYLDENYGFNLPEPYKDVISIVDYLDEEIPPYIEFESTKEIYDSYTKSLTESFGAPTSTDGNYVTSCDVYKINDDYSIQVEYDDEYKLIDIFVVDGDTGSSGNSHKYVLTSDSLGLGEYPKDNPASNDIDGISFSWLNVGDYGHGMQFKKNAGTIYNTTPISGNIAGITVYTTNNTGNKNISPALEILLADNAIFDNPEVYDLSIDNGEGDYQLAFSGSYQYIKITSVASAAMYFDEIDIFEGNYSGGNTPSDDGYDEMAITNKDASLPVSETGIYDIDFTKSNYKNIEELLGYGYMSTGKPKVLVVPVEFPDYKNEDRARPLTIDNIKSFFLSYSETNADLDYKSLYDFMYESSFGKLDLDIDIIDTFYMAKQNASYYASFKQGSLEIGDQVVIDEILRWLDGKGYDLSNYDSDKDGYIDSIVVVNSLTSDLELGNDTFTWAFQYFNSYFENESTSELYEYDGVSANIYAWFNGDFFFEDSDGKMTNNPIYTYTLLHEFSHVIGASDYYDTAYEDHPLDGYDIMDSMVADHSPYTKFIYGWIEKSRLICTDSSVTVTLNSFEKTGDTIIFGNHFDEKLGAFQEYYIVTYYTEEGLNEPTNAGLFGEGIVVYHIDSSTFYDKDYDVYDIFNTNTNIKDPDLGTIHNLIEFVEDADGNRLFEVGDTIDNIENNLGETINYSFTIDKFEDDVATLTFTKTN